PVPWAVAVNVTTPGPAAVYCQTNEAKPPAGMVTGPGGEGPPRYASSPPPAFRSRAGTTRTASSCPVLLTPSVMATSWPVVVLNGDAASRPTRCAGGPERNVAA